MSTISKLNPLVRQARARRREVCKVLKLDKSLGGQFKAIKLNAASKAPMLTGDDKELLFRHLLRK